MGLKRTQSPTEAAEILGCEERTVRRHCNDRENRAPHTRRGRRILVNAEELLAWGRANNVNWRPGRPVENPDSPDLEKARLRKENALAAKYELHVARERSQLVPIDEVNERYAEEVSRARSRFLGFAADTAAQCVGLDAGEIQTILDSRIRQILNDLATGLQTVGTAPATAA